MIRVLSVIHYPTFGGPHNQVLRLAGPLSARGFSTLVVLPDEPGNGYARLQAGGVDVVRMRMGRLRARLDWRLQLRMLGSLAGDVPRLAGLIRRERIDLVVVHGLVNPQAAIAARLCRRPVVWQVVDIWTPRPLRLLLAPVVRALAASVMTTGHAVADAHPGLPRDPGRRFSFFPPVHSVVFAPGGPERDAARHALGFGPGDLVVGCITHLAPIKGLETFIETARAICALRSDVRFALLGGRIPTHDAYAERLLSSAADLRERGSLIVRDPGDEVSRYVRALDLFLGTSRSEGITTTILEAMAAGIPVVSTDVGGIHEAVVHGTTGYLVPPDDPSAIVSAVSLLLDDPPLRARFSAAARERAVAEFDVERCADVHADAFRAALAVRPE